MTALTPATVDADGRGRRSPMRALAQLLGCTEGQAYTAVLCTVVTLVAACLGIPPTLRDRPIDDTTPLAVDSAGPRNRSASPPGVATSPGAPPAPVDSARVDVVAPSPSPLALSPGEAVPGPAARTDRGGDVGATPSPSAPAAPTGFGAARVAARVGEPGAPDGVAVDRAGRIHVATNNGLRHGSIAASRVFRYRPDGTLDRDLAITGQSAARGGGLTGLVVAADGAVLVLDTAPARVLRVDIDAGRQETLATIPDLAPCAGLVAAADGCEAGVADDRPSPRAIALASGGVAYVTDTTQGLIWRIDGDDARPWYRFDDGGAVGGPAGVAVDTAGDVLVTATSGSGTGLVLRIDVRPDGTAGDVTTLAETGTLSTPVGIAAGDAGTIVVALAGSDAVVLLATDGSEIARLTSDAVAAQAGMPLDAPAGVALHRGEVLVTNQSSAGGSANWAVLAAALTA